MSIKGVNSVLIGGRLESRLVSAALPVGLFVLEKSLIASSSSIKTWLSSPEKDIKYSQFKRKI